MDTDRSTGNEESNTGGKNWLSSTGFSLSKLSHIQPAVYNLGSGDPNQGRNIPGHGRSSSLSNLAQENSANATPPTSHRSAWGSNTSIPELLRQYNVNVPRRPESAKTRSRVRPPSGRRVRPGSAKESQKITNFADSLVPRPPSMAVKGAKFDPSGKPPKGAVSHHATVGWVGGPSRDLSKEDAGNALQQFIHDQADLGKLSAAYAQEEHISPPPPPPSGSPDLERMLQSSASESESHVDTYEPVEEPRPPPGPIHFSLPTAEESDEDDGEVGQTDEVDPGDAETMQIVQDDSLQDDRGDAEKLQKSGVKIAEEFNTTIDITPRGLPSRYYRNRSGTPNLRNVTSRVDTGLIRRSSLLSDDTTEGIDNSDSSDNEIVNLKSETTEHDLSNRHTSLPSDALQKKPSTPQLLARPSSSGRGILKSSDVHKKARISSAGGQNDRHRNLISHKHNKGTPIARPSTVAINYADENDSEPEDEKRNIQPQKKFQKRIDSNRVETLISEVAVSDNEDEGGPLKDSVTGSKSDSGRPSSASFTRIKSGKEKNYFELLRHSKADVVINDSTLKQNDTVVKTTKTLEFGNSGLQESKTVSILDNLPKAAPPVLSRFDNLDVLRRLAKPKNKGVASQEKLCDEDNRKNDQRISEMTHSPVRRDIMAENKVCVNEPPPRPGSRIGHHVMPPSDGKPSRKLIRPNSAATSRRNLVSGNKQKRVLIGGGLKLSQKSKSDSKPDKTSEAEKPVLNDGSNSVDDSEDKKGMVSMFSGHSDNVKTMVEDDDIDGYQKAPPSGEEAKSSYSKPPINCSSMLMSEDPRKLQIDRLKNKARIQSSPLPVKRMMQEIRDKHNDQSSKATAVESSHHSEIHVETKDEMNVPKRRQVSFKDTGFKTHYRSSSAKVTRKKAAGEEPIVILTLRDEVYMDTDQVRECKNMHFKMLEKGVNIPVDKLTWALLPPGQGSIKSVTTQLPRQTSSGLLSHPSVWLSKEFKRLKLAEKAVRQAHERIWEQEQAEKRKAGLLLNDKYDTDKKKKIKKKGNKKVHKRSTTVS